MAADGVELAAAVHGDGDVEFVVASPGEGGVELVVASTLRLGRARATGGCIRAAVEHLSFPDNSFDVTLAVTVVQFVADPAAAVAELARVTRGGGRIIIGALNPHSPWGLANRRRLRSGVWCHARFLSPTALGALGAAHGRTSLHGALYAPGAFPGLSRLGALLEIAGRAAPTWGAFQVLAIDKDRHS